MIRACIRVCFCSLVCFPPPSHSHKHCDANSSPKFMRMLQKDSSVLPQDGNPVSPPRATDGSAVLIPSHLTCKQTLLP